MRLPLLLLGALLLRVLFFGGLLGWDDIEYWEAARALRAGDWAPHSTFQLRYTVTLPLALCQAWLGEREWAAFVVPLAYSTAHLALAWALGRLVGGVRVAVAATVLLAIVPLDVIAATDLHADLPLAVFLAAAGYAVLRAETSPERQAGWLAAAGLALGLAVITKEVALALTPFLALRLVRDEHAWRRGAWVALGGISVLLADVVWSAALTGHPLYRYATQVGLHAATVATSPPGYRWMLGYSSMLLDPLSGSFGYFAGLFYVVVIATWWGLRRGEPPMGWLTLWWGSLLVAFNFAPLDRSFQWPLFHHFARTLHPLLIPFVLAAGLWLGPGLAGRRVLRAGIAVVVAGLALVGIVVTHRDYRSWAIVARQAAPVIARLPADARVVTDTLTANQLRFLLPDRRDGIVASWSGPLTDDRGPLFVLTNPVYLAEAQRGHRESSWTVPAPSASWQPVAQFVRRPRPSLRGMLGRLSIGPAPASPQVVAALWRVG